MLQVKPQVVPSQVAAPFVGIAHGVHDVPHELGLVFGWHVPWVGINSSMKRSFRIWAVAARDRRDRCLAAGLWWPCRPSVFRAQHGRSGQTSGNVKPLYIPSAIDQLLGGAPSWVCATTLPMVPVTSSAP
jgi:hypothetical protein